MSEAVKISAKEMFVGPPLAMNRFERPLPAATEALVSYLDGDFRVIRPGGFVRCAVTGVPIPLDELRYWNVDRQEAYANIDAKLRRLAELGLIKSKATARP